MASNKTKLSQAGSRSSLPMLDLDDIDDIFDDKPIKGGGKKSAISEFVSGLKGSVLDKTKSRSVLRAFLQSGAPDGYSRLFGAYDDAKQFGSNLIQHLERTNPSDMMYLTRKVQSIVPMLKEKVPASIHDRVDAALTSKVEQYKYQIESNRDQLTIRKRAQTEADETQIRGAMDQISIVQRSLFNRGEEAEDYRHKQDQAAEIVRDQITGKRFEHTAKGMAQAVDALTRMASYNEQVNYDFQKKGLELQFRTYQGIRDLAKLTESGLELQNKAFQAIVRNTAIPDHLKSSIKDLVHMNMKTSVAGGVGNLASKTLSGYLGNFVPGMQNKANSKASGALQGIVQGMQTGEGMGDMWDQRYNLAGQLAGDGIHGIVKNHLMPMLGRKVRPMMTNLSNKKGGGRHNQVGYMMDNAPAMMQEFVNNYQNTTGVKGILRDMMLPFTPQFGLDTKTRSSNYQTIGQQSAFNQLTQRSITEVIPGYLARILREVTAARTGDNAVGLTMFDVSTGRFAADKDAQANLQARIVPKSTTRMVSSTINETLDHMQGDDKLSPGARKALSERMLRDGQSNKAFDPGAYSRGGGYKKGTSKEVQDELKAFMGKNFAMDSKGKMVDNADNHAKRQDWSKSFLNIRNSARDPAEEIHRLIDSGKTDTLRDMGIVITDDGIDRINYDKLWEIMSSEVSGYSQEQGFGYHESAGDKDDRNFVGPRAPSSAETFARGASKKVRGAASKYLDDPKNSKRKQQIEDAAAKLQKKLGQAGAAMKRGGNAMAGFDYMGATQGLPGQAQAAWGKRDQTMANMSGLMTQGKDAAIAKFGAAKDQANAFLALAPQQKMELAQSILNNAIAKEPPAMKEARIQLASQIMSMGAQGKDGLNAAMNTSYGQQAHGYGAQMKGYADQASANYQGSSLKPILDLKVKGTQDVAIKARDILEGKLFDVNTRLQILSADMITGEVKDELNRQVISAAEAAKGLVDSKGVLVAKAKAQFDAVASVVAQAGGGVVAQVKDKIDDMVDWYKEGDINPAIECIKLKAGEYRDQMTGKVLESMDDIQGPVVDSKNRVVATVQDLLTGLRSIGDRRFTLPGLRKKLGKLGMQMWKNPIAHSMFGLAKGIGKFAFTLARNSVSRLIGNRDAYIEGSEEPILTVESLKAGKYFQKDGKPLSEFSDVRGDIMDAEGNVVIAKKDLPKLLDHAGKKHAIAKSRSLLRRVGHYAIEAPVKFMAKKYMGATKSYYKWLGKKMGGGAKALGLGAGSAASWATGISGKDLSTTDQILVRILESLEAQKPEELRKGSWMDQEAKEAEAAKASGKEDPLDPKSKKGIFAKLGAGLAGLFDKLRGKKEEAKAEDEEGSMMDDAMDAKDKFDAAKDAASQASDGAKGLGKLAKKLANSKLGKGVGKLVTKLGGTAVGKAVMGAGARIGMMAATGLATLISAPVLIGIGAVAAVGAGAWWLWSRHAETTGEFRSLRMLQYGITSTGERKKILALEQMLEKSATRGADPQISITAVGGKEIIELFGLDIENPESIMRMGKWFDLRFKPVLLTWMRAMNTIGKKDLSVNDVDEKVPKELKGQLLEGLKLPTNAESPYKQLSNPFDNSDPNNFMFNNDLEPLEDTTEDIAEIFKELGEKYKIPETQEVSGKLPGVANAIDPKHALAAAATVAVTKAGKDAIKDALTPQKPSDNKNSPSNQIKEVIAGLGAVTALAGAASIGDKVPSVPGNNLNALDSIRARAYGMETLNKSDFESLVAMEIRYERESSVTRGGEVMYDGDLEQLIRGAGSLFGMNTADAGDDRVKFVNWMYNRFVPVVKAYISQVRQIGGLSFDRVSSGAKPVDQVRIANTIMGATSPDGSGVWSSPSLFPIQGKLEDLKKLADADLIALKKLADSDVMNSPTQSSGDQAKGAQDAASGGGFFDSVKSFAKGAVDAVSDAVGGAVDAVSDTARSVKYKMGMTDATTSSGQTASITKGNGGSWEQIPMPTANRDRNAARVTLQAVDAMTGCPVGILMVFASMESGFDYLIKASSSSATGWFQFIDATWDTMIKSYSGTYGLPPDDGQRSLRKDPRINGLMGACFVLENVKILKKALGRDPTDTDLYIAHFMGPYGARQFLTSDQNATFAKVFPKPAAANTSIAYDGSGKARTLGEVYKLFDTKVAKHRDNGGGPKPAASAETKVLTPEEVAKAELDAKSKAVAADPDFKPAAGPTTGAPTVGIMAAAPVAAVSTTVVPTADTSQVSSTVANTPATGSTPTTSGSETTRQYKNVHPQASAEVKAALSGPRPGEPTPSINDPQSSPMPTVAPTGLTSVADLPTPQVDKTAQMNAARDKQRMAEVATTNKFNADLNTVQQQQLTELQAIKTILSNIEKSGGGMGGGGASNSIASGGPRPTRGADKSASPVKMS